MKRQFKFIALVAVLFLGFNFSASAQLKIGHINSDQLISLMPETATVDKELKKMGETMDAEFKNMYTEYEAKAKKYSQEAGSQSETTNQNRAKEMQDLEARIQAYQQNANQELQKKRYDLLKPILDKAQNAIDEVAKEKALDFVLDTSKGSVIFAKDTLDILAAVKTKLGIK